MLRKTNNQRDSKSEFIVSGLILDWDSNRLALTGHLTQDKHSYCLQNNENEVKRQIHEEKKKRKKEPS